MSLVKVQGNASGTGTLTIAAPNTNTNQTLTLPDQTGTLIAGTSGIAGEANGGTGTTTGYYSFKNRLINGNMAINQRVTTLSTTNTYGYSVDRMWGFSGSSTAATFAQISSTGLANFPYALRAQRTAANTGTAGYYVGQIIESNNLQDLQSQSVTVSFWARAGANYSPTSNILTVYLRTGTVADQGMAVLLSGWTGAVDQTSNVTLTTSWQFFNKTFTVGSTVQEISAFVYAATTGTAGANDYFDITGFTVEKGSTATSFDFRDYGTEFQRCQRYYEVYDVPLSSPQVAVVYAAAIVAVSQLRFVVPKRAAPAVTLSYASARVVFPSNVGGTAGTMTTNFITTQSMQVASGTTISAASAGWIDAFTAYISAEL